MNQATAPTIAAMARQPAIIQATFLVRAEECLPLIAVTRPAPVAVTWHDLAPA
jgi:hypothetical protein